MHSQDLIPWLRGTLRKGQFLNTLGALGALLFGLLLVGVFFGLAYAGVWALLREHPPYSHLAGAVAGVLLVSLLFLGNARRRRSQGDLAIISAGRSKDKPFPNFDMRGRPIHRLKFPADVWIKDIFLFSGPQMVMTGLRCLGRAWRLGGVDVSACAAVLAFLARRDERVAFPDLVPHIPHGHKVPDVLEQMCLIDGVMFLKSDPPGLSLTSTLREELRRL
jgi:hypothetical protein